MKRISWNLPLITLDLQVFILKVFLRVSLRLNWLLKSIYSAIAIFSLINFPIRQIFQDMSLIRPIVVLIVHFWDVFWNLQFIRRFMNKLTHLFRSIFNFVNIVPINWIWLSNYFEELVLIMRKERRIGLLSLGMWFMVDSAFWYPFVLIQQQSFHLRSYSLLNNHWSLFRILVPFMID